MVFETHVGWKLYGKEPTMGWLADVDHSTAVVGALSGGMHGLMLLFACGFFLFSSATLWLSYFDSPPGEKAVAAAACQEGEEKRQEEPKSTTGWDGARSPVDPSGFMERVRQLVLGRSCHPWLLSMGTIMVFAGLWCALVGCLAFYLIVTTDFTHGLEVDGWLGEYGGSVWPI